MSKVELATACKVSVKTIDAWIVKGAPHTRLSNGRYQFTLKAVQRWRADGLQPAPATPRVPTSYTEARARKEAAMAGMRELELRKRTGELVSREAVHKEQFTRSRQVRDAMFNLPARLSGVFAAETDQQNIFDLFMKEVHQALEALVNT